VDYYFIGEAELVTAFNFIGVEGRAVVNGEEARTAFLKVTRGYDTASGAVLPTAEPCKILILTEECADWLGEDLTAWQMEGRYPLVVEIPGIQGRHQGRKTLIDNIREAIGLQV
jgi:V/A-type H+-transporting ATPase subunit F